METKGTQKPFSGLMTMGPRGCFADFLRVPPVRALNCHNRQVADGYSKPSKCGLRWIPTKYKRYPGKNPTSLVIRALAVYLGYLATVQH